MTRRIASAFLALAFGMSIRAADASTLEEQYIGLAGWCPGLVGPTIQAEHGQWHMIGFPAAVRGKEFLEFHREFLAQSDDYRLYGLDTPGGDVDPDAAVIPVTAQAGSILKFAHLNLNGYMRPAGHTIDPVHPHPGLGNQSPWVARGANLKLRNALFHGYSANGLGVALDGLFHGNGHMSVANHDRVGGWSGDMGGTTNATRDGAFFQWHKNVDNIYSDWAVGQYQLVANTGLPIYFSVERSGVGAAGTSLNDRRQATEYQGSNPPLANQYGAIPRIGSDIYVGNSNSSNLQYAVGIRAPGAPAGCDLDAHTILNPAGNGWYFSVTPGSVGVAGTAVAAQLSKGGDVFESGGGGTNALFRTEAVLGLLPTASDNLDALEVDQQKRVQGTNDNLLAGVYDRPKQWFSLRSGTTFGLTALGGAAVGPCDVLQFNANGDLLVATAAATLGLGAAGDELDALAIVDTAPLDALNATDRIYYSLAAGSPALGANSPADIFCHTVGGATCGALGGRLEMTAAMLGLLATDDLDALDVRRPATGLGACCLQTGNCQMVLQTQCTGIWWGPETVCSATPCPQGPGACCLPNGPCVMLSSLECEHAGGEYFGPGTPCNPALCHQPPPNDDCYNAYPIPYDYQDGYEPPADNTYAHASYEDPTSTYQDPTYGCHDHEVFFHEYGSGTIWYTYDVPVGLPPRPLGVTTVGTYDLYGNGENGYAGDTRLGLYYAPNGDCQEMYEVACGDNNYDSYDPPMPPYGGYAELQYDNPQPGRYYLQVATSGNVYRGRIRLQVFEQVANQVEDTLPSSNWVRVHPNPTAQYVTVECGCRSDDVSMQVVDLSGRMVKQLEVMSHGGRTHASWDRRDTRGETVSAGVYFIVVRDGGSLIGKRIAVVQ